MSTRSWPSAFSTLSVTGLSLIRFWLVPDALTMRRRMSWLSSHGVTPYSSSSAWTAFGFLSWKIASAPHVSSLADDPLIGALAEEEIKRADKDRFARSGLAGDYVQARPEIESDVLDQGQVLDAKGGE